ncbi:MAG: adenylyltransferase/cytidyltransferase family protein [Nanoarchaeota archaeon]
MAQKKTVMVFGSFDVLHPGHLNLFRQAKKLGGELIVVIARDTTIEQIKKKKPVFPEKTRKQNLLSSLYSSRVVLGNKKNKHQVILQYKPDVIALGYDQTHFVQGLRELIQQNKLHTTIIRLKPYRKDIYKSTKLAKGQ